MNKHRVQTLFFFCLGSSLINNLQNQTNILNDYKKLRSKKYFYYLINRSRSHDTLFFIITSPPISQNSLFLYDQLELDRNHTSDDGLMCVRQDVHSQVFRRRLLKMMTRIIIFNTVQQQTDRTLLTCKCATSFCKGVLKNMKIELDYFNYRMVMMKRGLPEQFPQGLTDMWQPSKRLQLQGESGKFDPTDGLSLRWKYISIRERKKNASVSLICDSCNSAERRPDNV